MALWGAACGLDDSENIHFQQFLCFSSNTLTFVVKSLVCLSYFWGCWIAPPVILLTHTNTHSLCVFLYSALRRCAVWKKALSRPYLPSIEVRPLYTSSTLYISSSVFSSLMLSHQTHTSMNRHKGGGRPVILEI